MQNINLVALCSSVSRAYEIAKAGQMTIKLIAGERSDEFTTSEKDLQLLREFYQMEDTENPDLLIEVVYDSGAILNCLLPSNRFETLDHIQVRIDDYNLSDIVVSRELCKSCTSLLKTAIERLKLDAHTAFRIVDISQVIAKLAGSDKIKPEHIAEAIQYRSIPIPF